jgi:hypothetical protein
MNIRKRQYILSWIALGILIPGITLLLILPKSIHTPGPSLFISMTLWMATITAAIWLFLKATGNALLKSSGEAGIQETAAKTTLPPKKPENIQEQLDISAIAKKIVRRISPSDDPAKWGKQLLSMLVSEIEIMSGIFYFRNSENRYESLSTFAYPRLEEPYSFTEGEGLSGQAVKNRQVAVYRSIPDDYTEVFSGLGSGKPLYLAFVPILIEDQPVALLELAGFKWADEKLEQFFQIIAREITAKTVGASRPGADDSKESGAGKSEQNQG